MAKSKATASKPAPAAKEAPAKAEPAARDKFNSRVDSQAGQINAVLFAAKKPLTVADVAAATQFDSARIRAHLDRLAKDELVSKSEAGYAMPAAKAKAKATKASK